MLLKLFFDACNFWALTIVSRKIPAIEGKGV